MKYEHIFTTPSLSWTWISFHDMFNITNDSINLKNIKFRRLIFLILVLCLNSGCFVASVRSKHLNCDVYYNAPSIGVRRFQYRDKKGNYTVKNDMIFFQTISGQCH